MLISTPLTHHHSIDRPSDPSGPSAVSGGPVFHVVFMTGCSVQDNWQSLLLFHSAETVKQRGVLTRIAYGCSLSEQRQLSELYRILHPRYHVYFTPHYYGPPELNHRNHILPSGLVHWLEMSPFAATSGDIVAVIEPDFVFLRPLTEKLNGHSGVLFSGSVLATDVFDRVRRGYPVAQQYEIGAPWVKNDYGDLDRDRICGKSSPCTEISSAEEGDKYYSIGPPYIAEREDLLRLAHTWVKFLPLVKKNISKDAEDMTDVYAYALAAAHERLPHLRLDHFMVSNRASAGEGWRWVDALGGDVCSTLQYEQKQLFRNMTLPTFLHYCQQYRVKGQNRMQYWEFFKAHVKGPVFDCTNKMPAPPSGLAESKILQTPKKMIRRDAFVVCTMYEALRSAVMHYRNVMCTPTGM